MSNGMRQLDWRLHLLSPIWLDFGDFCRAVYARHRRCRLSDQPPTPLHLPFPLIDFQPSLIGADDDLEDLDVVRAAVLDTARSLHPGAEVQGGEVVFRRVPRQRGVSMNSVVEIDGEPKFFLTVVTGVGNEVLVHELPPGGFTFIVDNCRR